MGWKAKNAQPSVDVVAESLTPVELIDTVTPERGAPERVSTVTAMWPSVWS